METCGIAHPTKAGLTCTREQGHLGSHTDQGQAWKILPPKGQDRLKKIADTTAPETHVGPPSVKEAYSGSPHAYLPVHPLDVQIQAADKARAQSATMRERIYAAIYAQGSQGLTDAEGQELLGIPPNTYRPRRTELSDGQMERPVLVVDSGRRRVNPSSGNRARVWVACEFQGVSVDEESDPVHIKGTRPVRTDTLDRDRILNNFVEAGEYGVTDEEGVLRLGILPGSYGPRRNELVYRERIVRDSGRTRLNSNGNHVTIWVVDDAVQ